MTVGTVSFPVVYFDQSALRRSYFCYSELIDFWLYIMAAQIWNIFFQRVDVCSSWQSNVIYMRSSVGKPP